MVSIARRRELGAFYTPSDVADRLVAIALDGLDGAPVVCDPACGDGAFLLAAAHALAGRGLAAADISRDLLWGCDIEPDAVAAARRAFVAWSGVDPGDHLVVGDGLETAERWRHRFDAVIGNPPFLNQLERATVRRVPLPGWLQPFARPYTDTAWLFLLAGRELVRPGGRVALVQPQSMVAARDAAPIRTALTPVLEGLWWCDEPIFDASVHVCAPVFGRPRNAVRRWSGRLLADAGTVSRPDASWTALVPSRVPPIDQVANSGGRRLGDIATATAGFRDEFYGLQPHVVDEPDGAQPLLVTSGLIDVGRVQWGQRTTRFGGRAWLHPRVDVDGLTGSLARWVAQRLAPKVVLATQTKVLEAAVDHEGRWVPSTPVIAVHAPASELWRIAAALSAPGVSAWAARRHAGAALQPEAIKLSAKQVLDVPLPIDETAWDAGATALEAGCVLEAGQAMSQAYGTSDDVFAWWVSRLPRRNEGY